MNAKLLGFMLVILILGGGAYYLYQTEQGETVLPGLTGEGPSVSALRELKQPTVLAFAIDGQQFTPLRSSVDRFFESIKDLPLAGGGLSIEQAFKDLLDEQQQKALSNQKSDPREAFEALSRFFNEFRSFQFSVSDLTFEAGEYSAIPYFSGTARFESSRYPEMVGTVLQEAVKEQSKSDSAALVETAPSQYALKLSDSGENLFTISTLGNSLTFQPEAAETRSDTAGEKSEISTLQAKAHTRPALSAYFEGASLVRLARSFVEANSSQFKEEELESLQEGLDAAALAYGDVERGFVTTDFQKGLTSRGCIDVFSGSETESVMAEMYRHDDSVDTTPFLNLIIDRTFFAGELSVPQLAASFTSTLERALEAEGEGEAEGEEGAKQLALNLEADVKEIKNSVERLTDQYGLERIGVVLNPGSAGFIPDAYLYITSSKEEVNLFEKLYEFGLEHAPDFKKEDVQLTETGIRMKMGQAQEVVGRRIDGNRYVFALSDFLLENALSLVQEGSPKATVASALAAQSAGTQIYTFLNTDSIISFAQPFLQMMIAAQQQETGVTPETASKLLDQLKTRLLYVQKVFRTDEDGLWCAENTLQNLG